MVSFVFFFFFAYRLSGATEHYTPIQLYTDGYGLPSCLTVPCIKKITGANLSYEQKAQETALLYSQINKNISVSSLFSSFVDIFFKPSPPITVNLINIINKPKVKDYRSDNEKANEKDKKKSTDNNKTIFVKAVAAGVVGAGLYVLDFMKHQEHSLMGCDYSLSYDGRINEAAFFKTHRDSFLRSTTVIDFLDVNSIEESHTIQKEEFRNFYTQGAFIYSRQSEKIYETNVYLYGQSFNSWLDPLFERFCCKRKVIEKELPRPDYQYIDSFPLPCKPKKMARCQNLVFMVSFDGYLYVKNTWNDTHPFTRLYIKKGEPDLFEETIIDISSTQNYIVLWTHSGRLIRVELLGEEDQTAGDRLCVRCSEIVTDIPKNERIDYKILDCDNNTFSLVRISNLQLHNKQYSLAEKNNLQQGVYPERKINPFVKLFHRVYRLIVNRPLKVVGILLMSLSLYLYFKYSKRI